VPNPNPIQWAVRPLKKYAVFSGRAPRAEYWWYVLATTVVSIGFAFADQLLIGPIYGDLEPLGLIQTIALIVPGAAVTVRRLHDLDRTGWWFLLNLWGYFFVLTESVQQTMKVVIERLPTGVGFVLILGTLAGAVILFVFLITPGTDGPNDYGSDPYGPDELEEVFA
jgi:uncharacterized membrane protein YhaH (DUF805 family)